MKNVIISLSAIFLILTVDGLLIPQIISSSNLTILEILLCVFSMIGLSLFILKKLFFN